MDDLGRRVSVVMRRCRVEGQGISFEEAEGVESDDGFEFALQDIEVFAAVVSDGLSAVGGLAAGGVDNLEEVHVAVVGGGEAFPAHAGRKFNGAAIIRPLHDARPVGTRRSAPRARSCPALWRCLSLGRFDGPARDRRDACWVCRRQPLRAE